MIYEDTDYYILPAHILWFLRNFFISGRHYYFAKAMLLDISETMILLTRAAPLFIFAPVIRASEEDASHYTHCKSIKYKAMSSGVMQCRMLRKFLLSIIFIASVASLLLQISRQASLWLTHREMADAADTIFRCLFWWYCRIEPWRSLPVLFWYYGFLDKSQLLAAGRL